MLVLSARPFRSVVLDAREGSAVVSKRFHHPNPLLARFDGARARREFAALTALERAGLPVPHPLEMRASDAGWEIRLTAVEGARTLGALLDAAAVPPGGWTRLAARLGEALARLQQSGFEHGDLHPGNVLVDAHGAPWLIDLGRVLSVAPDAARCLSELVHCAAAVREVMPARARARFLVAWLQALPRELRPQLAGRELAHALEQRARVLRRHQVQLGLGRWLRESSRVRRLEYSGVRAWVRRDLDDAAVEPLLAAPPPAGSDARWTVLRGERSELRARWLGAARLHEHRLPAARPVLFVPGSRWPWRRSDAWAAFEPPEPARRAPSGAALLEALAERGLALAAPAAALARLGEGAYLSPPREPDEIWDATA